MRSIERNEVQQCQRQRFPIPFGIQSYIDHALLWSACTSSIRSSRRMRSESLSFRRAAENFNHGCCRSHFVLLLPLLLAACRSALNIGWRRIRNRSRMSLSQQRTTDGNTSDQHVRGIRCMLGDDHICTLTHVAADLAIAR